MKKILKGLLVLPVTAVVGAGGLLGFLTATEYKPADVETLEVRTLDAEALGPVPSDDLSVLSWNIGYAGLGKEQDFFMDGGSHARPGSAELVNQYLDGIRDSIEKQDADLVLLQEVDTDASRTYGIDETTALIQASGVHALNYSCAFVPVPLPPMRKVHSGLFTTADYAMTDAQRIALPNPFSWPMRAANLKRCLLVNRLPVEGSDKELVLVNLHLEAYDDGEGKAAQTRQLMDLLQEEYEKGNFVIAGGDFNQVFPGSLEVYPNNHPELWEVGALEESSLPEGFRYAFDTATPTCRLLNQPYDPADTENTQYYVIDGFIVSPNVSVEAVETVDLDFENSDHNPVRMTVDLAA